MAAPQEELENRERASWLRTLYQIAHSDTRWAKEQGWRVVNWTLLLFGGLFGIAHLLRPHVSVTAFLIASVLVLVVAVFYLIGLHRWALSTRGTAERIEAQIPDIASVLDRRCPGEKHLFYLTVQLAVVLVAFVFAVLAHVFANVAV